MTKLPDKLFGREVKGSLERVLAEKESKPTEVQSPIIPATGVINLEKYIILEGKTHGSYSYSDLLVSRFRLSYSNDVAQAASRLGYSVTDTSQENNGLPFIGKINWEQALKLNLSIGGQTLNLRQYADFLELLKSGNAFDGNGKKIQKDKLDEILDEIFTTRNPFRGEWLDADFKVINGKIHLNYNHRLVNGQLVPQKSELLEPCVHSKSYVNFSIRNRQGLPNVRSEKKEIYFWPPDKKDNSVARLDASSSMTRLICIGDRNFDIASLGVREVREKINT